LTQIDSRSSRPSMVLAAVFGLIFVLVGWDLLSDYGEGVNRLHVLIESAVLVISGAARLVTTHEESERWRQQYREALQGLARAIQIQFEAWALSPAEAEIGLLLLKGLSLKEIAALRETSERTVREQARSVYRKAGVANRASLSAYFLEDLLLPSQTTSVDD